MKDYYQILGVPENSCEADIKRAFRKLAFQYHPDKNPGREREAEERFKDINEAYGVLCDPGKRRQFDFARKGAGAYSSPQPDFAFSQQDIFTSFFSNQAVFNDLNRMFAEAGLRFDEDLVRRMFFSGQGVVFQFHGSRSVPGGFQSTPFAGTASIGTLPHKVSLFEKLASRITMFLFRLLFRVVFGSPRPEEIDHHAGLEVSKQQAKTGIEKEIVYQRNGQSVKLVVKVPPGVKTGTRIRLKGMGQRDLRGTGDLYLHVKVK